MNPEQQLQSIEISIEQAKEAISMAEALDRLHKNPDFQKVILEGYFKEEASRAVLAKGDPNMREQHKQDDLMLIIDSIGGFRRYLGQVFSLANMAEQAMEADSNTREEILQEQLEEAGETLQ